jgi:hypothetical protein
MRNDSAPPAMFSLSIQQRQPSSPVANLWVMVVTGILLLGVIFVVDRLAERAGRRETLPFWASENDDARGMFRRAVARDTMRRRLASLPNTPRLQFLTSDATTAALRYGNLALRNIADSSASGRVIGVLEPAGWDSIGGIVPIRREMLSLVPSALDGKTCITWIPTPSVSARPDSAYRKLRLDNAEGPCHVIAAFGLPSPERMAWLDARGWVATVGFESRTARRRFYEDAPAVGAYDAKVFGRVVETTYFPSRFGGRGESGRAVRCVTGDNAACTAVVFASSTFRYQLPGAVGAFDGPWVSQRVAGTLLRTYGAEKFRRWWTSPDTTDAGFEKAFGVTVAEFARDRVARSMAPRFYVPTLRLVDVLPALIVLAFCVAWIAFPAPREANV